MKRPESPVFGLRVDLSSANFNSNFQLRTPPVVGDILILTTIPMAPLSTLDLIPRPWVAGSRPGLTYVRSVGYRLDEPKIDFCNAAGWLLNLTGKALNQVLSQ